MCKKHNKKVDIGKKIKKNNYNLKKKTSLC